MKSDDECDDTLTPIDVVNKSTLPDLSTSSSQNESGDSIANTDTRMVPKYDKGVSSQYPLVRRAKSNKFFKALTIQAKISTSNRLTFFGGKVAKQTPRQKILPTGQRFSCPRTGCTSIFKNPLNCRDHMVNECQLLKGGKEYEEVLMFVCAKCQFCKQVFAGSISRHRKICLLNPNRLSVSDSRQTSSQTSVSLKISCIRVLKIFANWMEKNLSPPRRSSRLRYRGWMRNFLCLAGKRNPQLCLDDLVTLNKFCDLPPIANYCQNMTDWYRTKYVLAYRKFCYSLLNHFRMNAEKPSANEMIRLIEQRLVDTQKIRKESPQNNEGESGTPDEAKTCKESVEITGQSILKRFSSWIGDGSYSKSNQQSLIQGLKFFLDVCKVTDPLFTDDSIMTFESTIPSVRKVIAYPSKNTKEVTRRAYLQLCRFLSQRLEELRPQMPDGKYWEAKHAINVRFNEAKVVRSSKKTKKKAPTCSGVEKHEKDASPPLRESPCSSKVARNESWNLLKDVLNIMTNDPSTPVHRIVSYILSLGLHVRKIDGELVSGNNPTSHVSRDACSHKEVLTITRSWKILTESVGVSSSEATFLQFCGTDRDMQQNVLAYYLGARSSKVRSLSDIFQQSTAIISQNYGLSFTTEEDLFILKVVAHFGNSNPQTWKILSSSLNRLEVSVKNRFFSELQEEAEAVGPWSFGEEVRLVTHLFPSKTNLRRDFISSVKRGQLEAVSIIMKRGVDSLELCWKHFVKPALLLRIVEKENPSVRVAFFNRLADLKVSSFRDIDWSVVGRDLPKDVSFFLLTSFLFDFFLARENASHLQLSEKISSGRCFWEFKSEPLIVEFIDWSLEGSHRC